MGDYWTPTTYELDLLSGDPGVAREAETLAQPVASPHPGLAGPGEVGRNEWRSAVFSGDDSGGQNTVEVESVEERGIECRQSGVDRLRRGGPGVDLESGEAREQMW